MPGPQDDLMQVYSAIREAENRLFALRKESKQELPPIVKAGAPCVWNEDHQAFCLHFPIHTSIREVWYGENMLYEVPSKDQHPFTVHLYYRPVGPKWSCDLSGVFTEEGVTMPHIDSGGACMAVATAPEALLTLKDYRALRVILTRHCQGINLMSLYTNSTSWPHEILNSLPEEIEEWLTRDDSEMIRASIKHLFKSVANTEWAAEPEPEPEFEEDPEPSDGDYHMCECDACVAARQSEDDIQQTQEISTLNLAQAQAQLAQTQGALQVQQTNQLWQIQGPLGVRSQVDPNEIWSI